MQGYIVHEIWGCEYEQQLKSDPDMKAYIDSLDIQEPLDARRSLFRHLVGDTTGYRRPRTSERSFQNNVRLDQLALT